MKVIVPVLGSNQVLHPEDNHHYRLDLMADSAVTLNPSEKGTVISVINKSVHPVTVLAQGLQNKLDTHQCNWYISVGDGQYDLV